MTEEETRRIELALLATSPEDWYLDDGPIADGWERIYPADAQFIMHCRGYVRDLLAEVKRLQATLDALEEGFDERDN